jgi:copper chaperone NosL
MVERTVRGAVLLAAMAVVACGPTGGPAPIVWDREACAHCRMLISEPAFAAQLRTADGEVESFDDPGCLFARLDALGPGVQALWFHHLREERWIPGEAAGFVPVDPTPMGYGLGAVDAGSPDALPLEQARVRARARSGHREGAP